VISGGEGEGEGEIVAGREEPSAPLSPLSLCMLHVSGFDRGGRKPRISPLSFPRPPNCLHMSTKKILYESLPYITYLATSVFKL